jgi:predicted TIM-barrel fold metal-dependent hydrolase
VTAEARRLGIDRICVSCLADWDWTSSKDPAAGNALVFAAADRHPEMLGYVYVDPRQKQEALGQVNAYLEHPAVMGIKLWISCPANDPVVHPIAEAASQAGLVMLVHSWRRGTRLSKGYQTLPRQVAELALRFPEVPFIMAHMGGDWESGILEVEKATNVLVDTSGSINEAGMVEKAVQILGADRVVYGSDAPGAAYLPNLGKVLSAEVGNPEKLKILAGNVDGLLARGKREGRRTKEERCHT